VHQDLLVKLQFDPRNYSFCSIGNDRPNVSQIIRSMEHTANSYRDLDFLVPEGNATPNNIKKTFLYTDDIKDGGKIIDHLNERVNDTYRSRGLVRAYNAGMSREYREQVMSLFKAGVIRILVCTDAAGMGCDIPDIELVVQWKAPQNLSSWVQRAGRAARGAGTVGMAIMLVENSTFEVSPLGAGSTDNPAPTAPARGRGRGRGRGIGGRGGQGRHGGKKQGKDYAESHDLKRGWFRGVNDTVETLDDSDVEIPADGLAEGLYALIQATICRRVILSRVFKNEAPTVPKETCCDICNPKLFDHVRPSKPIRAVRQKGIRKGPPVDSVRQALFRWRRKIKKMHYPHALFAPHAILDDATCEVLASIGPIDSIDPLQQLLQSGWSRWEELGDRLYAYMHGLVIPPLPAPVTRKKPAPTVQEPPASATSTTSIPSTSRATSQDKRRHPTHGTSLDDAAPSARRPRMKATPQTPHIPQTPSLPRPIPIPTYRGYVPRPPAQHQ
ncbi:hypothetical protein B0H10DRAFT_2332053, partial [Mycena sp. CBHHK59/15]